MLYGLKRYEEALAAYRKVDTNYYWIPGFIAACHGQLGQRPEAERALADFRSTTLNMTIGTLAGLSPYVGPDWLAHLIDGLRKAGMPE